MAYEENRGKINFGGELIYKRYGKKTVLNNASFRIERGGIVGIFGLNGAGKTTLLNILSGLDGNFKGSLLKTDFTDVAYASQKDFFPPDMRIKDYLNFEATFSEGFDKEKIRGKLAAAKISEKSFIFSLSSGLKQYFKFLSAVFGGKSVVLLDEPFSNLDVNLRGEVVNTLIDLTDENRLFLITTHEIKELERLIDGFFILSGGALSEYYDAEEIVGKSGKSVEEFYRETVNEKNI